MKSTILKADGVGRGRAYDCYKNLGSYHYGLNHDVGGKWDLNQTGVKVRDEGAHWTGGGVFAGTQDMFL